MEDLEAPVANPVLKSDETQPVVSSHQKKLSSGSDEFNSNEATINEELMDHGENSTTLSSINESQKDTPEKLHVKMRNSSSLDHHNAGEQCFYSFKKEVEFKEMLDNLDIENIEISLSRKLRDDVPQTNSVSKQF